MDCNKRVQTQRHDHWKVMDQNQRTFGQASSGSNCKESCLLLLHSWPQLKEGILYCSWESVRKQNLRFACFVSWCLIRSWRLIRWTHYFPIITGVRWFTYYIPLVPKDAHLIVKIHRKDQSEMELSNLSTHHRHFDSTTWDKYHICCQCPENGTIYVETHIVLFPWRPNHQHEYQQYSVIIPEQIYAA